MSRLRYAKKLVAITNDEYKGLYLYYIQRPTTSYITNHQPQAAYLTN